MSEHRPHPFRVLPNKHDRVLRLHWDITTPVDKWEAWALIQSDEHFDSTKCDRETLHRHHAQALERNAPIIKVGDTFDAMQGPGDPRAARQDLRDEYAKNAYFDQLAENAAKFYAPFAENIVAIGRGNHEESVVKHYGTDLTHGLAKALRAEGGKTRAMGYDFFVVFGFKRDRQQVSKTGYFFHGSGGGGKGHGQARKTAARVRADLIATGHTHDQWHDVEMVEGLTGQHFPTLEARHQIKIGNYKRRGHWETTRGMPHKPIGAYWLRFTFKRSALRMEVLPTDTTGEH